MNEIRPSKKQRELLSFIEGFIKGYGYGPSYREIMRALDYKSVSTVAVHVDGLIAKGFLRKKDNAARTLELVSQTPAIKPDSEHIKWLKRELESCQNKEDAAVLRTALDILSR